MNLAQRIKRRCVFPAPQLRRWIKEIEADLPPIRGYVSFVIQRNWTWVEWALYAACWARHLGFAPILVLSKAEIFNIYRHAINIPVLDFVNSVSLWRALSRIPDVHVLNLDDCPVPGGASLSPYRAPAAEYARTTAAYELRVEEDEQGALKRQYIEKALDHKRDLAVYAAKLEASLASVPVPQCCNRIVSYSGLIGKTPIIRDVARRLGWTCIYVEGWSIKPGHMLYAFNTPALDYDVHRWLDRMPAGEPFFDPDIESFLAFQEDPDLSDVPWLQSYHRFQRTSIRETLPQHVSAFLNDDRPIFLLCPNVVGDSATLQRRTIFQSQRDWINRSCEFFKHNPQYKLLVRAHPDEKFLGDKVVIALGSIAQEAAADAPNILVITGYEDTSTYALIPKIKGGLVWVSTVGVDLAVRAKPVILAARAKYSGLSIAHEPATQEEYFDLIHHIAKSKRTLPQDAVAMAKRYLRVLSMEFTSDAFSPTYRARDLSVSSGGDSGRKDFYLAICQGQAADG